MTEKEVFFNMEAKFQTRLRYYMIFFSILQIIESLTSGTNVIWQIVGLGLPILVLYYAIYINRAPIVYFKIILLSFWVVVIFDGLKIYRAIISQQFFIPRDISAFLSVLLIVIAIPTLIKYRNSINRSKNFQVIE